MNCFNQISVDIFFLLSQNCGNFYFVPHAAKLRFDVAFEQTNAANKLLAN